MDIVITYSDISAIVERSLSIIGKRSVNEDGNPLFDNITLGSREDEIINDYIKQAVNDLVTVMSGFVTAFNTTNNQITLTFPSNHNTALDNTIRDLFKSYCCSYVLYSWFTVTAPRLSEKYLGDCNRCMASLTRLIHEKTAPAGSSDILSTSTSVS